MEEKFCLLGNIFWDRLKNIFNDGEAGSRIIITTRDEKIALTMKTFLPILKLKHLEAEECWSLLAKHVFGASSVAVDESSIYGRDNDRKKLKGFLLSDDAREADGKIGVVSIVGMGGLGKTTLAKQLFNDPEVKKEFNWKGWPHISKDFDVLNLTKALLESITGESSKANFLDTLLVELQQSLKGKKFLLVLDDIWDVIYDVWNNMKDIFNVGETGSRIIITTRYERIALQLGASIVCHGTPTSSAVVDESDIYRRDNERLEDSLESADLLGLRVGVLQRVYENNKTWRIVGLVSGVVGLLCFALSPSFNHLIRGKLGNSFFMVCFPWLS